MLCGRQTVDLYKPKSRLQKDRQEEEEEETLCASLSVDC